MSVELVVPKVGLTVETLEVVAWHKAAGDRVEVGEAIVDLAADKADLAIEAPAAGVLGELRAAEGDTVAPGDVLAVIAAGGEGAPPTAESAAAPAPIASPDGGAVVPVASPSRATGAAVPPSDGGRRVRISPLARRLAADHGLALDVLRGTGPRGRIVRRDVEAAAVAPAPSSPEGAAAAVAVPPSSSSVAAGDRVAEDDLVEVRWTAARRATARAMALSASTVAPVTLHRRAGADAALAAVKRLKAAGLPATFTHAILAAAAHALAAHPRLNAVWDGDRLLHSRRRHVGLAVDDGGDLLLGVVADADARDTTGLVLGAVEAVARARARETPSVGPTFTISNLGMFGIEQFTPIVSPPAIAVLGVGAVVDGRCHLSLTFDHRAVDGAPAARFLTDVADRLQEFDGR